MGVQWGMTRARDSPWPKRRTVLSILSVPKCLAQDLRAVFRWSFQLIRDETNMHISSPTTRARLSQQAITNDPMSTSTRLLLSTQRTPTNGQHRQASINAALNEDRIGIRRSHRRRLGGGHSAFFPLYRVSSEIEIPHTGPGRQSKSLHCRY